VVNEGFVASIHVMEYCFWPETDRMRVGRHTLPRARRKTISPLGCFDKQAISADLFKLVAEPREACDTTNAERAQNSSKFPVPPLR